MRRAVVVCGLGLACQFGAAVAAAGASYVLRELAGFNGAVTFFVLYAIMGAAVASAFARRFT